MNNGLIIYILMREREMQVRCIMIANSANFHNINSKNSTLFKNVKLNFCFGLFLRLADPKGAPFEVKVARFQIGRAHV